METVANIIGVAGTILILLAYFLLQAGRISSDDLWYSMMNLLGAAGVLVSLVYAWNLPAFIIESFWIAISAIGIWKFMARQKSPDSPNTS